MKKSTRSKDGFVVGHPPAWVSEKLLEVMGQFPGPFAWGEAKAVLLDNGVADDEVEAMLHALRRVPGVTHDGERYYRGTLYERNVTHRAWRITPRRLDVHDAEVLVGLLDKAGNLTPNLTSVREQLTAAIRGLNEKEPKAHGGSGTSE